MELEWPSDEGQMHLALLDETATIVASGLGILKVRWAYQIDCYKGGDDQEIWRVGEIVGTYRHLSSGSVLVYRSRLDVTQSSPVDYERNECDCVYIAPAFTLTVPKHLVGAMMPELRDWLFDGMSPEYDVTAPESRGGEFEPKEFDVIGESLMGAIRDTANSLGRGRLHVGKFVACGLSSSTVVCDNLNETELTALAVRVAAPATMGEHRGIVVIEASCEGIDVDVWNVLHDSPSGHDWTFSGWLSIPAGDGEEWNVLSAGCPGVPLRKVDPAPQ